MVYDIDEVDLCSSSDPKILFIVKSNAKDQEKRKTIRETWYYSFGFLKKKLT